MQPDGIMGNLIRMSIFCMFFSYDREQSANFKPLKLLLLLFSKNMNVNNLIGQLGFPEICWVLSFMVIPIN